MAYPIRKWNTYYNIYPFNSTVLVSFISVINQTKRKVYLAISMMKQPSSTEVVGKYFFSVTYYVTKFSI